MGLEQLTRKAIDARQLDAGTLERIQRYLDRRPHLAAEEYEALCSLGKALRAGHVKRAFAEAPLA